MEKIRVNLTVATAPIKVSMVTNQQVQTDWDITDNTDKKYIKNKPTKVSDFENDSAFISEETDPEYNADKEFIALKSEIPTSLSELSEDETHRIVTDTEKSDWNSKQTALGFTPENVAKKGQALGYCELDGGGKIPLANLPSTLLKYVGTWNASTNIPTLTNPDTTKKGNVYLVSVSGTQFGIDFKMGDWLIYNDSGVPEKSDNSDDVVSVNSKTGTVVLNTDDISDTDKTNKFTNETEKSYWNSKVDAEEGKGLSEEDYTTEDKTRLANTEGTNTGDQEATDFDIKDLTDSTNLRNAWNNKVDKVSGNGKVYTNNGSGNPSSLFYSSSASDDTIVYRGSGGTTSVGTPTATSHATPKSYVDGIVPYYQIKTTLDATLELGTIYQLGTLTGNISMALPTPSGAITQKICIKFDCGATPYTFTLTGTNFTAFSLTPVANTMYDVEFEWNNAKSKWTAYVNPYIA